MKKLSLALLAVALSWTNLIFSTSAIGQEKEEGKYNFIVLLDLSDRMLNTRQADFDKEMIKSFFKRFEEIARTRFFIRSHEGFHISIIPQYGSPLQSMDFEEKLNIQLDVISPVNRAQEAGAFFAGFEKELDQLYEKARIGEKTSDYFGVDIWSYFNNRLSFDLKDDAQNIVLILTDGYFDFENHEFTSKRQNRFTSSIFLKNLDADWHKKAESENYGYLPADCDLSNTQIIVAGIHPKKLSQTEEQKLTYFWEKWLKEMKCPQYTILPMMNPRQIASRVYAATALNPQKQ